MIIVIDHEDSFTYNLVHYFQRFDEHVAVYQSGAITTEEIRQLDPELIVLSPGPGHPPADGTARAVLRELCGTFPVLGVCLGHQVIVEHFGGRVVKGDQPVHGKVFEIMHERSGLFAGISTPTPVARYHSLVAERALLPDVLHVTAQTSEGEVMGIRHKELPVTGIQFHPESIATAEGFVMLQNAYEQAKAWKRRERNDGTTVNF